MRTVYALVICCIASEARAFNPYGDPGVICQKMVQGGPLIVDVYVCLNDWEKPTASNGDIRIVVDSVAKEHVSVAIKCSTSFMRTKKGIVTKVEGGGQLNTSAERPTSTLILEPQISRADRRNWRYFAKSDCTWTAKRVQEPAEQTVEAPSNRARGPLWASPPVPSVQEHAPRRSVGPTLCARRSDWNWRVDLLGFLGGRGLQASAKAGKRRRRGHAHAILFRKPLPWGESQW